MTVTVSFFDAFAGPLVELAVNVTFAVPAFFAVTVVIDVPGASGCSAGGATYFVPDTVTPPEPDADHRSFGSVGNWTTMRCPTLAVTESGSAATNSGPGGFVGVGVGVGVGFRVYVGLAEVGDGVADLDFLVGEGLADPSVEVDASEEPQAASIATSPSEPAITTAPRAVLRRFRNVPLILVSVPHIWG